MNLIDKLRWRYATKKFDPDRSVSAQDLECLKEAVRLSVSSFGIQPYKVIIIENKEIKKALVEASMGQQQVADASHLFVFCNYTRDFDRQVDDYIEKIIEAQGKGSTEVRNYGESIKASLRKKSPEERERWAEKQTYLALNNLLVACAELKIDACPMEGFDKEVYNQMLGLDEQGLNANLIAPIGYRSKDDKAMSRKKIRKSKEELFEMA
tara:strand:+ start:134012 stop:134641 length:630 start_codon:yes stop_codon:yes gene_type:complete